MKAEARQQTGLRPDRGQKEQPPVFTQEELELLRKDAETAERTIRLAGLRFTSIHRKRYNFAVDVSRGAAFTTEKTLRWAWNIKRDVAGRLVRGRSCHE